MFEKDPDLAHTVVVVDHFGRGGGIHRVVQQVEQCREFGGKGSAVGIEQATNIDVYFVALRRGRRGGGGGGIGAGTGAGVVRGGKCSVVGIEQARNIDVYFVALRRGRGRGGGVGTGAGTGAGVVRGIGSGFLLSRGDDNIL